MLTLSRHTTISAETAGAANLTPKFLSADLKRIGEWCDEGYQSDVSSRADWLRRIEAAMDLALQLQTEKSFPWPGCSNVAFPLVTIAAMEFHSRAYPELVNGTDIVRCRVPGPDPKGELKARADRVGTYMSHQVLEEDQAWQEGMDRLLLQEPIIGCVFKKTRHLPREQINVSELVPAVKLVMAYNSKSVESCPRKTHILELGRNDVWERCKGGLWRDILDEDWYRTPSQPMAYEGQDRADKRIGQNPSFPDSATDLVFLEQHCWMDADGDGYAEPYVITFEGNSKEVVRIVARWDQPEDVERLPNGEILRIRANEEFTKYELIPSPDGGIYGMGFGVLLGPLNEAVNTLVNQLTDAGTLSNTAGGFLARGVKLRGGAYTFTPFGWNRVDTTGEDLQKGVFPLPVREPSTVLFTLLSFLVDYTSRISGSTDMLAGMNPGQNTPASTSKEMVVQGLKIYSALFKRQWRCMKEEFNKLFILNGKFLPTTKYFGDGGVISREDFLGDPSQIRPSADPNVVDQELRIQRAMAVADRAHMVPGYDIAATERNLHVAMRLEGAEVLYPGPDKVPPLPNPKVQVEQMKMQIKEKELQQKQMQFAAELQEERGLNQANIIKLLAQAEALAAQAASEEKGHQIALVESMIGMAKLRNEQIQSHIDSILKSMELENERRAIEKQPTGAAAK